MRTMYSIVMDVGVLIKCYYHYSIAAIICDRCLVSLETLQYKCERSQSLMLHLKFKQVHDMPHFN